MSHIHRNIHVSGPVIIENNAILLNREKEANGQGEEYLMLPGGSVEEGESLEQACKREVLEELGIDIEIISYLGQDTAQNLANPDQIITLHYFLARRIGEIIPGPETLEWGWYRLDNLPENVAPNIKELIQKIHTHI